MADIEDYMLGEFQEDKTLLPPSNLEAEESVVGSLLINEDSLEDVQFILNEPVMFYNHKVRYVWEAILGVRKSGRNIDLVTVADELDKSGKLREIGGQAYLTSLIGVPQSSASVLAYASIVEEQYIRRVMVSKASEIAALAHMSSGTLEELVEEYAKTVEIGTHLSNSSDKYVEDSDDVAKYLLGMIDNGIPSGVLTGFPIFDDVDRGLAGFPIGATLLIGDSSWGKSALVEQMCEQVALSGRTAMYCGFESENFSMVARRAAGATKIQNLSKKIRSASLSPVESVSVKGAITAYIGRFNGRLKFNSKGKTIAKIEKAIRKHRPDFVVIDQISQIEDAPTSNPTMNLIRNFTALKALGNKYGCAVLVVHAISAEESRLFFKKNQAASQGNAKMKNTVPDINSIPWASQLKFIADVMLFLVPDVNIKLRNSASYTIIVWIMKDREGTRFVPTWWDFDLASQWYKDILNPYGQHAQRPSNAQKSAGSDDDYQFIDLQD